MRIPRLVLTSSLLSLLLIASAPAQSGQRFKAVQPESALKLRANDAATALALAAGGAERIADYGSFQMFSASSAAAEELAGSGLDNVSFENVIELHAGSVDTRAPLARQARAAATGFSGKRLHLVQFAGPVKPEWYRSLEKTGVTVVDYIPHNAYLVYGDAAALQKVSTLAASLPAVQFHGAFLDADKIHPTARATASKRQPARLSEELYQIQMVADDTANADTLAVIDALKLAPIVRQNRSDKYFSVVVKLPPEALDGLSSQPDILSIWPYATPRKFDERQGMIVAGNLSGNGPSGAGYLAWLASKGFTQSQFDSSALVVDVTDSGLDNGTTNVNHFALFRGGTTSDVARVRYVRLEGTANSGSTLQGCDGHGNLNSHIISGYVTLTNFPHTDSAGYRYGLGIAPFVRVGQSVIFDPSNFTSPDYEDLASRAYRDGARVSGNSWGADTAGGYDVDAQQYDAIVRDAQQTGSAVPVAGNQQMTFVFAAGNAGSGTQTVGSPGTAKNVITVGAAENVHSHATTNGGNNASGNDGCTTPDSEANSANDVATFSSRGPCADSRKKPEIMAPGTHVTGGVGQNVKTMSGNGTSVTCFDGTGVCALPGGGTVGSTNNFFPLGQKWYSTSSGTSHSTPCVAGGAALVYQWFLNNFTNAPSPAMIKAFLMNAARYMNGTGANDSLYSNNQGMGMMNLGTAFDGTPRLLRDQLTNDIFTASGQTRTYTGQVVSNSKPLRVTLTWTDAPGSTSGNSYNNNLNLSVVVNGQTYLGNVFSGQSSTSGGSADVRNNAESVFLPAGATGAVVITVSAGSINSDGVPNYGTSLDQDYALVAYNFQEVQTPVIASAGIAITSESCGLGNGAPDPGEIVGVRFALQNVGSAPTTNVMATLQATGGVTSPNGPFSYGALLAGGAAVSNTFTFTATGTCGGTVTATLALQDGATSLGSIVQAFTIGGTTATVNTNQNTAAITIADNTTASPYPSTITVSGLGGTISKVTATLTGFTHTYPEDADILLVGPAGQSVVLMGAVGGGTDASGVTLTFDDAAASAIGATVTAGTYKPSGSITSMTAPAPAAPYGSELAVFNGTSPNGTWSLYVLDAAASDSGNISGGWRLAITAGEPQCCASNQPPFLSSIGSKSVAESNALSFAVSAVDPTDGDIVTLGASNLPPLAVFNTVTNAGGVTNTFTWSEATPAGVYTTLFYAVDEDGMDAESILITVQAAGSVTGPVFVETMGTTGTSSESIATHESNNRFDNDDLTMSGTGDARNTNVSSGYTGASGSFNIMLNAATEYFQIDGINTLGRVGMTIAFGVRKNTTAEDGANLIVEVSSDGSSWTQISPASGWLPTGSGTATWHYRTNSIPDAFAVSNLRLRFRSLNTVEWRLDDLTLNGSGGAPAQTPPTLAPIGAQSVIVSNLLQFAVLATPTDGDTVTLTASNLPSGSGFGATNNLGYFTWNSASPAGVYTARFYAADNDGVASEAVTITVAEAGTASMETFSNLNAPGASYGSGNYVGDNSLTWYYTGARKPDATYYIDGQSIGFGTSSSNPRELYSQAIAGGIGNLSVKYRKYFTGTGTRSFELYVNDQLVGTVADANNTSVLTQAVVGVNIAGNAVIKIKSTGASQVALDSVEWTGYAGSGPDTTPLLTITTANQTVSFATTNLAVGGTSSNLVGEISWTNGLTGGAGTISAATSWLIASVNLAVGTNVITVSGTNSVGLASAAVTLIRESSDTDLDTIPDSWELDYFGSLTNVNGTSDWDEDGSPDVDEFRAGSNPTNNQSLLKATSISVPAVGNVIIWQSESNRSYLLSRSTDLLGGFLGFASNIAATHPLNTYTDAASTNVFNVYRVELE